MRPLPRLFAVTDADLCRADDFPIRAAAIAAGGPAVAVVVRAPGVTSTEQLGFLDRVHALTKPPEAAVFGHGDPAMARLAGASGVQLRRSDLAPALARTALGPGWIGVSIHDEDEARAAIDDGADYVLAGNVYDSASHTTRPGRGADWLGRIASLGVPVIAIGGVTADRVAELLAAGAWGVAAIGALWRIPDSAKATMAFLDQLTP